MASSIIDFRRPMEKLGRNALFRFASIAGCLLVWLVLFGGIAMPAIRELGDRGSLLGDSARIAGALVSAGFSLWIYWFAVRTIERRRVEELSLQAGARLGFMGLAFGLALWSTAFGMMWLAGAVQIVGLGDGTRLVAALAAAMMAAVGEELLFRGVMFRIFEQATGTLAALLISAFLFGLAHLASADSTILTAVVIAIEAGLLLGLTFVVTRSLWVPIGIHFAWNFAQAGIFGIAGSDTTSTGLAEVQFGGPKWLTGGTYGPEQSIITVALCVAAAAGLAVVAKRSGQWKMARFRFQLD